MAGQVPLISSACAGPLGLLQLPRLWQKLLLGARGQLHEDWDLCGSGFDQMLLDAIGLDRDATIAYVTKEQPSYTEFEGWVREHATRLSRGDIARSNEAIRRYEHDDATRKAILAAAGLEDDGSLRDAVRLNELEDWTAFHESLQ
jgi:hypothetical protein